VGILFIINFLFPESTKLDIFLLDQYAANLFLIVSLMCLAKIQSKPPSKDNGQLLIVFLFFVM